MSQKTDTGTVTCPACQTESRYYKRIRVKLRPLSSEEGDGNTNPIEFPLDEDFERSSVFRCPHCDETLQLHLEIKVLDIEVVDLEELQYHGRPPIPSPRSLHYSDQEKALLKEVETAGLLESFTEAVQEAYRLKAKPREVPKDITDFFITFLRTAQQAMLPRVTLEYFIQQYGRRFKLYKAQGVGMVVVDRMIRAFIPMQLVAWNVQRKARKPIRAQGVMVSRTDGTTMKSWIRTRRGYVPEGSTVFYEALLSTLEPQRIVRVPVFRGR